MDANLINRVAPKGQVMEVAMQLARDAPSDPPLSVRATVRARRWFLDRYAKEAGFHQALMTLSLTDNFHEAALAFKEERKPPAFRGRLLPASSFVALDEEQPSRGQP